MVDHRQQGRPISNHNKNINISLDCVLSISFISSDKVINNKHGQGGGTINEPEKVD
jgi:hypothetical protein